MKFFVFSIALFIVLNGSSAQLQSQASLRIQREFSEYVFNVETQAVNSANTLRTAIQARLNQFFNQYVTLRDRIGSRLNSLGVEGKAIAAKINKDVSSLVESLKNDTSDASLQPKVNQVLASLQSAYLDPIEKDIEDVRSAVNKNPRLIQCWDNNKGQLVTQFNKVLQRAQIVINAGLSQLDNHIVSLGNHVSIAVMKIEYDVDSKCEDDTTCIKAYVRIII